MYNYKHVITSSLASLLLICGWFCWFQGGLTATDVFAVEWIQSGVIHYGMTVSYFGFVSDGNSQNSY